MIPSRWPIHPMDDPAAPPTVIQYNPDADIFRRGSVFDPAPEVIAAQSGVTGGDPRLTPQGDHPRGQIPPYVPFGILIPPG